MCGGYRVGGAPGGGRRPGRRGPFLPQAQCLGPRTLAGATIMFCFLSKSEGGNSLAVQWLRLLTFTAEGQGLIPGWGAKIPQAVWPKVIMIMIIIIIIRIPEGKKMNL